MADALIRVAMAIDEELGGHGQWHRLVVDDSARRHRDEARRLAAAALRAVADLDWPDVSAESAGADGAIRVTLPAATVANLVRRVLADGAER